ncbi:vWA domain-containing protein [Demequina rhizosphaerae]|uniref:vWA domain-containing protein n=1 Tax=Demequina rhizosphaerae TaxID=1638985 RepID=UPI00155DB1CD|nr:vWA domain-containing protein [Demequina rhizosphaerae]
MLAAFALPMDTAIAADQSAADPTAASAVNAFGACLADGGVGDVLVLVDESGSLRTTDPDGARADALEYFIGQLTSFAVSAGVEVNVALSLFGDSYTVLEDWTPLNRATERGLAQAATSVAEFDDGFDTDYWMALEEARRVLTGQRAAHADVASCQAIAWFTDGEIDFDPRLTDDQAKEYGNSRAFAPDLALDSESAATQAASIATDLICGGGGLADQLRSSGIAVLAIGLDSGDPDFGLLKGISAGGQDAETCGDLPPLGTFNTASDIDGLLLAFDAIGSPGQTPTQIENGVCQGEICGEEAHSFVLDTTTSRVHVLASAEVAGLDVSLETPDGKIIELAPSAIGTAVTMKSRAAAISYEWVTGRTVSIDMEELKAKGWTGQWALTFTDTSATTPDARSTTNVRISSDFSAEIVGATDLQLHSGDVAPLTFTITDPVGGSLPLEDVVGQFMLDASIRFADGSVVVVADNLSYKAFADLPIDVDLATAAIGRATVTMEVQHTTAAVRNKKGKVVVEGSVLQPQVSTATVTVLPPLDYPVSLNAAVDFGEIDSTTPVTAHLAFEGDGCVWLDPAGTRFIAGPVDAGLDLTSGAVSADACQSAADGLDIAFAVAEPDNGTVNGVATVMVAPEGEADSPLAVSVEFTADVRKPYDPVLGTLGFVIAAVLGAGLPLGLVYLLQFWTSRIPDNALVAARIPVTVSGGAVLRDGRSFALTDRDLRQFVGIRAGGARSLTVEGVSMRVRVSRIPGAASSVVATQPGFRCASDARPGVAKDGVSAMLPLAIHHHWIVLVADGATEPQAEVLVLAAGDADQVARDALEQDISDRLPGVLADLCADRESGLDTPAMAAVGAAGASGAGGATVGQDIFSGAVDAPTTGEIDLFGDDPFGD